jgi:hypothetical protein
MAKNVLNQQLFIDLYAGIVMDVKKNQLLDLYANITMDVKKPIIIYKNYIWVLQWM